MRGDLKTASLRALLLLMASILGMISGTSTVSFSGDFQNSDSSTSISESGENVNVAGFVMMMPAYGVNDYPYSILAGGSMAANQVAADTNFSASISASGDGKTVSTNIMLQEDAGIAPVLCPKWKYSLALGDTATLNGEGINTLDQVMDISTISGFGTYPTSPNLHPTVTTGIYYNAFDENGRPIFPTQYVPNPTEFSYPLTLGVYYTPGAHFKNVLDMHVKW
ncbi:MAG: hypothetical protein A4E48_01458 [Methanosaeta sp. PtaU1.Bin060]|nr:MAG: hypothetical protein A4E48_01458 [Methanosaeta sp. PtaU1.Bin060]